MDLTQAIGETFAYENWLNGTWANAVVKGVIQRPYTHAGVTRIATDVLIQVEGCEQEFAVPPECIYEMDDCKQIIKTSALKHDPVAVLLG
jgi:hypothetical protein